MRSRRARRDAPLAAYHPRAATGRGRDARAWSAPRPRREGMHDTATALARRARFVAGERRARHLSGSPARARHRGRGRGACVLRRRDRGPHHDRRAGALADGRAAERTFPVREGGGAGRGPPGHRGLRPHRAAPARRWLRRADPDRATRRASARHERRDHGDRGPHRIRAAAGAAGDHVGAGRQLGAFRPGRGGHSAPGDPARRAGRRRHAPGEEAFRLRLPDGRRSGHAVGGRPAGGRGRGGTARGAPDRRARVAPLARGAGGPRPAAGTHLRRDRAGRRRASPGADPALRPGGPPLAPDAGASRGRDRGRRRGRHPLRPERGGAGRPAGLLQRRGPSPHPLLHAPLRRPLPLLPGRAAAAHAGGRLRDRDPDRDPALRSQGPGPPEPRHLRRHGRQRDAELDRPGGRGRRVRAGAGRARAAPPDR